MWRDLSDRIALSLATRVRRRADALRLGLAARLLSGSAAGQLNPLEEQFVRWNAERLGISNADSGIRYRAGAATFRGGYGGSQYRWFNLLTYAALTPLFGDSADEAIEAYRQFGPMHFLRMLSYEVPAWSTSDVILRRLLDRETVHIVDYGCGLAQGSIALARTLQTSGRVVHLTLVDVPTERFQFLSWLLTNEYRISHALVAAGADPLDLDPWDVLIATEFFEHVHDPQRFMRSLNSTAKDFAILVGYLDDHGEEFMHVSPDLSAVREFVDSHYFRIEENIYERSGLTEVASVPLDAR